MPGPVTFKEADMERAIKVAKKCGLHVSGCLVTRAGVKLTFGDEAAITDAPIDPPADPPKTPPLKPWSEWEA